MELTHHKFDPLRRCTDICNLFSGRHGYYCNLIQSIFLACRGTPSHWQCPFLPSSLLRAATTLLSVDWPVLDIPIDGVLQVGPWMSGCFSQQLVCDMD